MTIDRELVREWKAGGPGSCDWGFCDNDAIGWARCECEGCKNIVGADERDEWLPVCADCIERGHSKGPAGAHPMAAVVTVDDIEREVNAA
jgi:hypothetical protein